MNDAVLPHLRCPNCGSTLVSAGARGPLRCTRGHSFDLAKQGYATLTAGRTPHTGDSAEMIAARELFLEAGHYAFIADALVAAARTIPIVVEPPGGRPGLVVDAGTGTGYYLTRVLDELAGFVGLGLDVSKAALRRAARAHPRADAALADLWRPLPLADSSATLILDVFAPRNGDEFRRVLRPDGALLVVTPAAHHLVELVETYGLIRVDPDKADRVADSLDSHFAATITTTHRHRMHLGAAEVRTLIGMTPSARHVSLDALGAGDLTVTAAVDLAIYRPADLH